MENAHSTLIFNDAKALRIPVAMTISRYRSAINE
jgi:hypothetical protein